MLAWKAAPHVQAELGCRAGTLVWLQQQLTPRSSPASMLCVVASSAPQTMMPGVPTRVKATLGLNYETCWCLRPPWDPGRKPVEARHPSLHSAPALTVSSYPSTRLGGLLNAPTKPKELYCGSKKYGLSHDSSGL